MGELSRGELLSRTARLGAGLLAGGAVAALAVGPASAGDVPAEEGPSEEDLAIVRLAASAELLAIDFYTRAIASRRILGEDRAYLVKARSNEKEHYTALAAVLGETAPIADDFQFVYPPGTFRSRAKIAAVGVTLETAFLGAYLGGVAALADANLRDTAAQIGASEAQHLSVLSDLKDGRPIGPAFPAALDVEEATAALDPFLGE